MHCKILLIALGSQYSQDELAWRVCDRLKVRGQLKSIDFVTCDTPAKLPKLLEDYEQVFLMDAYLSETENGSIQPVNLEDIQNGPLASQSTHGIGVNEMLSICTALDCLPASLSIIALGISGSAEINKVISDDYLERIESLIDRERLSG